MSLVRVTRFPGVFLKLGPTGRLKWSRYDHGFLHDSGVAKPAR